MATDDGVTEVRKQHLLDIPRLEAYLSEQCGLGNIPDFKPPLTLKQFGHGQSNPSKWECA